MPSSTSSSDRPGLRLTASDRPGVAQPVPERDIPDRPWRGIFAGAAIIAAMLVGVWEWHWRAYGASPALANSDGLWAAQRRRIDHGDGNRVVITGSSRMLFDIDLDTWQRLSGERPIQLALEGTSPLPVLEDLADDPAFTGHLIVGVAPDLFFSGFAARGKAITYFHKESPAERVSQWLSQYLVEPHFAFDDPDFALATVVFRLGWPARDGVSTRRVRKLSVTETADRNTHMWSKLEDDADYREIARATWAEDFKPSDADRAEFAKAVPEQLDRAVKAVAKLRARGVQIVFVRAPTAGPYLEYEDREVPRATTWDVLLARTGCPGVHFKDHPELQGYELPEWSHLAAREKPRFTEALYRIIARDIWKH
jgi:hypothetical protein